MGKIRTRIINIWMPLEMSADELAIYLAEQQSIAFSEGLVLELAVGGAPANKTDDNVVFSDNKKTDAKASEFIANVRSAMDFIDKFADTHIGMICLENNISIELAIAAGAKMKEGVGK